jgi:hypothetical protein
MQWNIDYYRVEMNRELAHSFFIATKVAVKVKLQTDLWLFTNFQAVHALC